MTETLLGKFRVMISLVHTLPDEPDKLLPICDVMYAVCHLTIKANHYEINQTIE